VYKEVFRGFKEETGIGYSASMYGNASTVVPPESAASRAFHTSYEPTCDMYPYIRFWKKEFSAKDHYESPLSTRRLPIDEQKFVVFEPDRGGWNNIRMAAEVAIVFAHATGRTLVLPPKEIWYLLTQNPHGHHVHDNRGRFEKFFNFTKLEETMNIISMGTFMEHIASKGLLEGGMLPPKDKVELMLDPVKSKHHHRHNWLWEYLRKTCYVRQWEPGKYFIGFNLVENATFGSNVFRPFSGHESPRLTEMRAEQRRQIIPYDKSMHAHRAIYFPGDYGVKTRILSHFYTYLFWEQEKREHFYRRFVRDRLHYVDEIFCAAGQVVKLLHEEAVELAVKEGLPRSHLSDMTENPKTRGGDTNVGPTYFAYHVRRGDFQYRDTRISAEKILGSTKHLLDAHSNRTRLIYIATDEMNSSFFDPFREHFTVRLLRDYYPKTSLSSIDKNLIGMVEQVIAANAHTFIGTFMSSFTGYITRMRGYYRDGRYARTYFTTKNDVHYLHTHKKIRGPFWAREFETAHKEIDDDSVVTQTQLR